MVKTVDTKADFDAVISEDKLTVVDFFATWCGPCRMIAPKIEKMEKEFPGVNFIKVDVDENTETAEACGISAMPTFFFYKAGNKLAEVVGANEADIRENIEKHK